MAERDDGGDAAAETQTPLCAMARVVMAEAPDELRAALRAMSGQGAEPQRGLVRYARRRLAWLERRGHRRNRSPPGLLTVCPCAAGTGGPVQPSAGRIVVEEPRLPGAPPWRGTDADDAPPTSGPGRRAVAEFCNGGAPPRRDGPVAKCRSGRTIGPRGRAFFPGGRRPQSAAAPAWG